MQERREHPMNISSIHAICTALLVFTILTTNTQPVLADEKSNSNDIQQLASQVFEQQPLESLPKQQQEKQQMALHQALAPIANLPQAVYTFTQEKQLKLFKNPITSTGLLAFHDKKGLYLRYESPIWSAYRFTPKGMWEQTAKDEAFKSLPMQGDAFGVSALLSGIFSADINELKKTYDLYFVVDAASPSSSPTKPWQLGLKPKAEIKEKVQHFFTDILLTGSNQLNSLTYRSENGDSTTLFLSLTPDHQKEFNHALYFGE